MLEEAIRKMHQAIELPAGWAWGWDGRFGAALLVTRPPVTEQLQSCLQSHFDQVWNHQMLNMLPRDVNALVDSLDGIRIEQSLYTKSLGQDLLLWSAWWPWSGNSHISVRLGVHSTSAGPELDRARKLLQSIFTRA